MPAIRRLLVANRGEIAVRIVRACEQLGIESVVAVSEIDRNTLAAQMATRAVCIGPAASRQSYLRAETLIAAALGSGCQAIHPGYGFLSERPAFARMCEQAGLLFVGPRPESIKAMGEKLTAVGFAERAGVQRVPGSGRIEGPQDAHRAAERIGFPVLIKASAGGGGRGMRLVQAAGDLAGAIDSAASEARAAFGDASLYLEKFIDRARHIEIQVVGDDHGRIVHLGERDCSTQRRYQKLIEEAPSPVIDERVRQRMSEAAVRLARKVAYRSAGTVEFVYDAQARDFYFLEMNTRVQVEHPVTEMVTGRDLVMEQIRIAAGEALSFTQEDVALRGHAIECRINAEDPARNFMPCPGPIRTWNPPPIVDGVRIDTHCYTGYVVPPHYDSLLAKLIIHAADRSAAIRSMGEALAGFDVSGVVTTIPFHQAVLQHDSFQKAAIYNRWVDQEFMPRLSAHQLPVPKPPAAASVAEAALARAAG
ncbi:MAG TPA: acetyl-CoA carboxylase biotin carboxylase subunit [Xanthobacteraceae bacterium]|jgi:acetyl-CoA carboxylase biotin carboxylase subunit